MARRNWRAWKSEADPNRIRWCGRLPADRLLIRGDVVRKTSFTAAESLAARVRLERSRSPNLYNLKDDWIIRLYDCSGA